MFEVQCDEVWASVLKSRWKHSLIEQQTACANSEGNGPEEQDRQGCRYLSVEQSHRGEVKDQVSGQSNPAHCFSVTVRNTDLLMACRTVEGVSDLNLKTAQLGLADWAVNAPHPRLPLSFWRKLSYTPQVYGLNR